MTLASLPPPCTEPLQLGQPGCIAPTSVPTARAGEPMSHAGRGWEKLTDAAISALSTKRSGLVFMLWGHHARRKAALYR